MRDIVLAIILAISVLTIAECSRRVDAHDGYQNWFYPDQRQNSKRVFPCCNNVDCKPRPSKWVDDHWEVLWEGRSGGSPKWLRVPDQKVEQNYPDAWDMGDKQSHSCISTSGNIYCFRHGEDLT